jgi:hypothetical protein
MYIMAHIEKDKYVVQDFMKFIEREQNNECTHYGSKLEACTSVVNEDQTFEAGFSNERLIVYEAKWNSKWIG